MCGGSNVMVSDDMVRAIEVHSIAQAIAARISSTPQHHAHARASMRACAFLLDVHEWFANHNASGGFGANVPTLGEVTTCTAHGSCMPCCQQHNVLSNHPFKFSLFSLSDFYRSC
jgi:hypothetical protein